MLPELRAPAARADGHGFPTTRTASRSAQKPPCPRPGADHYCSAAATACRQSRHLPKPKNACRDNGRKAAGGRMMTLTMASTPFAQRRDQYPPGRQGIIARHSGRSAQAFGSRRAAEGATARNRSGPRPPCDHTLERLARRPPQTRPAPKGQEAARDPPPHPRASKLSGKRTERASLSRALRLRMPP